MAEQPPGGTGTEPVPDLEYDLAHEVTAPAAPAPHPGEPVQVFTRTDHDGDYGYDLAHDIPHPDPSDRRTRP